VWDIEWLVITEGISRRVPAFEFLILQPTAVRIQLLAIVDAVRTTGPDRWRDTTSHDSMQGVCAQLHEARDRHGQTLYRLYLRWQRDQHRVVLIDGGAKANATALPERFYTELAARATAADEASAPFATADDFARIALGLLDET
jgi:hypothetical protein